MFWECWGRGPVVSGCRGTRGAVSFPAHSDATPVPPSSAVHDRCPQQAQAEADHTVDARPLQLPRTHGQSPVPCSRELSVGGQNWGAQMRCCESWKSEPRPHAMQNPRSYAQVLLSPHPSFRPTFICVFKRRRIPTCYSASQIAAAATRMASPRNPLSCPRPRGPPVVCTSRNVGRKLVPSALHRVPQVPSSPHTRHRALITRQLLWIHSEKNTDPADWCSGGAANT